MMLINNIVLNRKFRQISLYEILFLLKFTFRALNASKNNFFWRSFAQGPFQQSEIILFFDQNVGNLVLVGKIGLR